MGRDLVFRAQWVTVVSWLTYPVVYIFPMLGFKGAQAVVNIQVGYCVSDVISKCGLVSSSTASLPPNPPSTSRSSCCHRRAQCEPYSRQIFFASFLSTSRWHFCRSRCAQLEPPQVGLT